MIGDIDHSTWCQKILDDLKAMLKTPIEAGMPIVTSLKRTLVGMLSINMHGVINLK